MPELHQLLGVEKSTRWRPINHRLVLSGLREHVIVKNTHHVHIPCGRGEVMIGPYGEMVCMKCGDEFQYKELRGVSDN